MCLFTSALRASVNKSHIPSLPQNNLYLKGYMIWKIAYIGAEFSFLHLTDACDRQWLYFTPGP